MPGGKKNANTSGIPDWIKHIRCVLRVPRKGKTADEQSLAERSRLNEYITPRL